MVYKYFSAGKCQEVANGHFCKCYKGYSGKYCDKPSCESENKCIKGILKFYYSGECKESDSGLYCICSEGWKGKYCDINICDFGKKCLNGGIFIKK